MGTNKTQFANYSSGIGGIGFKRSVAVILAPNSHLQHVTLI